MPEQYAYKRREPYPLSSLVRNRAMVRVRCPYCKTVRNYFPEDMIQVFGDVDVDSLMGRISCEKGADHGRVEVSNFHATGSEAVGLRIRRLVAIKIKRVPVWADD